MPQKKNLHPKLQAWIDARTRHHLSPAQVQMARELGMNPKKFGKLANEDQEPWKMPLPQFIEHLYCKHFRRDCPEVVMSIEEKVEMDHQKKMAKRARKLAERAKIGVELTPTNQKEEL